jgi:hypothetical protein
VRQFTNIIRAATSCDVESQKPHPEAVFRYLKGESYDLRSNHWLN